MLIISLQGKAPEIMWTITYPRDSRSSLKVISNAVTLKRLTLFFQLANACKDIGAYKALGLLLGIIPVALIRILIVLGLESVLVDVTRRDLSHSLELLDPLLLLGIRKII